MRSSNSAFDDVPDVSLRALRDNLAIVDAAGHNLQTRNKLIAIIGETQNRRGTPGASLMMLFSIRSSRETMTT